MKIPKRAHISDVAPHLYVKSSPVHGKGLFTAKRIRKGSVIGMLEGRMTRENGTYVLWLDEELGMELTTDLRFINHDDNPNVEVTDAEVLALRKIEPHEELFFDYQW